jgi:hypothetical protein
MRSDFAQDDKALTTSAALNCPQWQPAFSFISNYPITRVTQ